MNQADPLPIGRMSTDRDWLEACLGVLVYLQDEGSIPPGIKYMIQGVQDQLARSKK